jgi:TonB family protein
MMRTFGMLAFLAAMLVASANGFLQPAGIDCNVSQEPQLLTPLEKLIHYPEEARKNGIEGKVAVNALVNKRGSIDSVVLLKSSDSIFNKEAIRAMKSARFTPAMQDSTPIKVWITQAINFRLKDIPKSQDQR